MLSENYTHALAAMKDQAVAATQVLHGAVKGDAKARLHLAQTVMSKYPHETSVINKVLLDKGNKSLTIDSLTIDRLEGAIARIVEARVPTKTKKS